MSGNPLKIWVVTLAECGADEVSLSDQWFYVSEKSARACEAELVEHYGDAVEVIVEKKTVEV
jgi:hypothetical protein